MNVDDQLLHMLGKQIGYKFRRGPAARSAMQQLISCADERNQSGFHYLKWKVDILGSGTHMEDSADLIKAANEQLKEARRELGELANTISSVSDVVLPTLVAYVKNIRENRMAAELEGHQLLVVLRDVRKFFLEHDYDTEMARLDRFIRTCHELAELKNNGTLDAICDLALRLALKEESK